MSKPIKINVVCKYPEDATPEERAKIRKAMQEMLEAKMRNAINEGVFERFDIRPLTKEEIKKIVPAKERRKQK